MSDELLPYYEKELAYIRQMGAEFAKEHPKVAGRLGVSEDTIEDPHVSRLIESFAYLNARIQHKLDDDFPELSDAMLSVVFPHYQRPIPSMSIVQFTADEEQLDSKYTIAKNAQLETEFFQGENCRFTQSYDVDLYPIRVANAQFLGRPFTTPGATSMRSANSVLKLSLETFTPEIIFPDLEMDSLRFYLKGQSQHVHPLYQFLMNECVGIVLSAPDQSSKPIHMSHEQLSQVGFHEDEGLLPYPSNSFLGYRLLTEFFVFPEKFMFVDINQLHTHIPEDTESKLDIYFYLRASDIELEHNIDASTFLLGCTPVVNLFEYRGDPIRLDHSQEEYQILPDARRPNGYEVYSIDRVIGSTPTGEKQAYLPFYGLQHEHNRAEDHPFWFAPRRPSKMGLNERDSGTDVFLNLVDLNFNPNIPDDRIISLDLTVSNRNQPAKLPYNLDHPKLQAVDSAPPCSKIRCVTQFSKTVRPPLRNQARWRLISHLNLNHLSLTGGDDATAALKEIIRLYNFKDSSVSKGLIDSIVSVDARQISAPLNIDGHATMCRGIEVSVVLDDTLLSGSSNFVYASVLEYFFALYCPVNSFTRVLVSLNNKEGYLKKCPPRAGEKVFL